MSNLLENLNEKQREAVLMTEGPVMAIAGAGSGKTSVLTTRIAYLIEKKDIDISNILAITFTNKAAREMKERVVNLTDNKLSEMWISTFHAFCAKILRFHIELLGYKRGFQIIDDDDAKKIIKEILKEEKPDADQKELKQIRTKISKMKNRSDNEGYSFNNNNDLASQIYDEYQKYLFTNNLVDFDDLLLLTIDLFKQFPDIQKIYNDKFKYVLVDEFQDTNNVQYELVSLILGDNRNIFIVGDEDQSIYAFRGANIKNISKFREDYPDYHIVLLEENYRSTNNILNAANQIIKNNKSRIEKKLFSSKGDGESIVKYKGATERDEVEYISKQILKLTRKGYKFSDFAVLYRMNNLSRMFEDNFLSKHIPYGIVGNTSFYKRREIKDFIAYLRMILSSSDFFSFERAISNPRRGIGKKTLDKLKNYMYLYDLDIFEAIAKSSEFLGKSVSNKLIVFKESIEDYRKQFDILPLNDFVDHILSDSGYLKALKKDEKFEDRYGNLLEFKSILHENQSIYTQSSKQDMLLYLLEDISLKSDENSDDYDNRVTLMTVHSAKGLEFRVVFVIGLENGIFPMIRASEADQLEEERRLMYVAVTRAKELLFLTNANVRNLYGESRHTVESLFVKEIDEDLLSIEGYDSYTSRPSSFRTNGQVRKSERMVTSLPKKAASIKQRKSNLDKYQKNDLNKGDRVNHTKFGEGMVISVAGDNCIIAFAQPYGIKKLLKDHAAITKK
ncbi:MAG: ATP-dependent DNA helicase PcrA [Candidatus Izimaplasma bacterium HR2]|nr:MAG: ATP-dependent DNA helicase PcrA [Candidatus Izimaplasma bacterium HR2]